MARIQIAKAGGTINDDPKDLVLDSDLTSLMVLEEVDLNGSATEYVHNLGYYPLVYAWFKEGDTWIGNANTWHPERSISCAYSRVYQDTNKIYIDNVLNKDVHIKIMGNAVDNALGSGKSTSSGKLKIAKNGYDVDETDIRRLQFASGLDLVKKDTSLTGTVTITSNANGEFGGETYITHNLGYYPVVSVIDWAGFTGNGAELPLDFNGGWFNYYYYVTTTRLYMGVAIFDYASVGDQYTFKYQVYRNKIA